VIDLLITVAFSYLLGSIPFGFLLMRVFRGQDVRRSGSGNIGATNVARSSPFLGFLTLLLDAGKGLAAVWLARMFFGAEGPLPLTAVAALSAVVGHMFPVWLKFRGGKGVATGLGSFALLAPKALIIAIGVFLAVVLIFRHVSLGSISAAAIFPFLAWILDDFDGKPLTLALIGIAAILIVFKHQENIRRLIAGAEPRLSLRRG